MATETIQATDHKLYVAGEWIETGEWSEVKAPYDGTLIGRVPKGDAALVEKAIGAARAAFDEGGFPAYERAALLDRAAELVREREDDLTMTIAAEAGKPVKTARVEAQRCVVDPAVLRGRCAHPDGAHGPDGSWRCGRGQARDRDPRPLRRRRRDQPLQLPAQPGGAQARAGDRRRQRRRPEARRPDTDLVDQAGGGPLRRRPARRTGCRSSVARAQRSATRSSRTTGSARSPSPARRRSAGASAPRRPTRRCNLELGSNAPLIVNEDGDWETAADKAQLHAFSHAGQSCISVQRVLLHESIADQFTERFVKNVESLVTGDPMDENTDVGPVISPRRPRPGQGVDRRGGVRRRRDPHRR